MKSKQSLLLRNKKPKLLLTIIASLVLILALIQLGISYHLATLGEKVRSYEERKSELEKENRLLTEEINKITSLSKISLKAQELGFIYSTRVVHLTPQIPVALK